MKSPEKKLLDIKFDCKLSIENNISSFCERAGQKLHTLTRIFNYVNLFRRTALMKTFAIIQFNYLSINSYVSQQNSNNIHERALRVTYHDYESMFLELLQKDNFVTIQSNLQVLATDVFKAKNDLSPKIMIMKYTHKELLCTLSLTVFTQSKVQHIRYGIWFLIK